METLKRGLRILKEITPVKQIPILVFVIVTAGSDFCQAHSCQTAEA